MSKGLLEVGKAYAGQHRWRGIPVYYYNCMRMDEGTFQLGRDDWEEITVYRSEKSMDSTEQLFTISHIIRLSRHQVLPFK